MGDSLDPGGGDVGDVAHAPVEKVTNFLRSVFPINQYIHYGVYFYQACRAGGPRGFRGTPGRPGRCPGRQGGH